MDTREDAQAVADLFNELLTVDPALAQKLFSLKFACSPELIDSPTFIVNDTPGGGVIGVLGIVNGLFSEKNLVVASLEAKTNRVLRFQVMDVRGS